MTFTKPARAVSRVFLHCSASDAPEHDNVATMRQWHLARGWSDVGYNLFIRKDGTIEAGRPIELTPAAQSGHNTGTIAICLHGLEKHKFTPAQLAACHALCSEINAAYGGRVTFHGHCEVSAKACPVFDYARLLALDPAGRMGGGENEDAEGEAPTTSTLRLGQQGPAVARLQERLNDLTYDAGPADGIFGNRTHEAVRRFQRDHHLVDDGAAGPLTFAALG